MAKKTFGHPSKFRDGVGFLKLSYCETGVLAMQNVGVVLDFEGPIVEGDESSPRYVQFVLGPNSARQLAADLRKAADLIDPQNKSKN